MCMGNTGRGKKHQSGHEGLGYDFDKKVYIAMRSVLEAEIATETEVLRLILEVFVDNPENYKQEDRDSIFNQANMLAPSVLAGATARKDVSKAISSP